MKIILKGKLPSEVYRGSCYHCKAVFEEDKSKLTITDDQRDGPFARVKCPQCGKEAFMYPYKGA